MLIGKVVQEITNCSQEFIVRDCYGNEALKLKGPARMNKRRKDILFKIRAMESTEEIGRITRKGRSMDSELLSSADVYSITFPIDLDWKMKTSLIGACFLFDYLYFEISNNENVERVY